MKTNTENFYKINVKRNDGENIAVYEIKTVQVKTKEKEDKRATNFKNILASKKNRTR